MQADLGRELGRDGARPWHAAIMPAAPRAWHDRPRMSAITASLSQVYPIGSRVNERGRLEIGGCDAVELVREFGSPAYVVAEDDLRGRARMFMDAVRARHADFDVLFASKAFPCTAVYRLMAADPYPGLSPEEVAEFNLEDHADPAIDASAGQQD